MRLSASNDDEVVDPSSRSRAVPIATYGLAADPWGYGFGLPGILGHLSRRGC